VQRGRGGEADQQGELNVRAVRISLELLQQSHVNQIKRNGHLTKYFIVLGPMCQIQLDYCGNLSILIHMKSQNRSALFALAAAGTLWGLNVPLTKLALGWLDPSWLTVGRFVVAAPLLAVVGRRGLRDALSLRMLASGAIGFGAVILLQNAGIQHTSVSHAAMIVGAVPVLVALMTAGSGQAATRPLTWAGYGVALVGIAFVAGAGGGGSHPRGDLLVLASAVLSAAFIAIQPRLLADNDAAAVTAVQFAGGALVALPVAILTGGLPHGPSAAVPTLSMAALALAGTPLPFWLFAFGQARVPAELAGAFVNLEPVVGAAVGWLALGEPAAAGQLFGVAAVLAGIAMSTMPPKPAAARTPVVERLGRLAIADRATQVLLALRWR
jgi:drug/metabolite transporter (DMT)-like permease